MAEKNIHPIFDTMLSRADKEQLLGQKGVVLWMVGLSGSGKSTIARGLEKKLHNEGRLCQILDGDNLRTGLNGNLGFSPEDRAENLRRSAEVAKLFANCGVVTICSFISPTEDVRQAAKSIIGDDLFMEVFINTPVEECEKRDVKGLYQKARAGEIKGFTGIDAPFQEPKQPDVEISTINQSIEQSVEKLYSAIATKIK